MRNVLQYDKGDKVYIEYEVESRFYKNDEMYYKLKDTKNGTYLTNAYTADELIAVEMTKPIKKGGTDNAGLVKE